jgi:polar amino acid transport system substrate-binding protein
MRQLACTLAACLPLSALADCTRVINVPVSATGLSVTVKGSSINGIYPEMLHDMGKKQDCEFHFSAVPRARLEMLFETGKADLLIPASKTPRRDEFGIFVPLIHNRATLISLTSDRPALKSIQEFIDNKQLRLVLVRGFDYGPAYQELIGRLKQQDRLFFETDPLSVARVLKSSTHYLSIMAPSIFYGAIIGDPRVEGMQGKLRYEPLPELPWGESGAYISKSALNDSDKTELRQLLEYAEKSGAIWKGFQRVYPAEVLKESIRPLSSSAK